MLHRHRTEPTERSMPPLIMTMVMPSAMTAVKVKLRVMLKRLLLVAKELVAKLKNRQARMTATKTQKAWLDISHEIQLSRFCGTGASSAIAIDQPQSLFRAPGRPPLQCALDRASNQTGDFLRRTGGDGLVSDLPTPPQHHDPIGDGEDIRHAMADQDDGDALVAQSRDQVQALGDLPYRDGGSRFIHQHDFWIGQSGAGDRHRLALAARHAFDEIARPRLRFQLRENLGGAAVHRRIVEDFERPDSPVHFASKEDIGGGGQIVAKRQILMHDLDAVLAGLNRPMHRQFGAFHAHRAMGGAEIAGDDLHQRRFAGAIVAHQPDDLAGLKDKRNIGEGLDGAEMLGDILQLKYRHDGARPPVALPRLRPLLFFARDRRTIRNFADHELLCGPRIPRQYRKSLICLPSRCVIVNLLSDKSAPSIGGAGKIKPSFRMIISLTEKNAAYRLAIARDIMAFQRNLETFLAKRPLDRQARDLAVFLGA